MLPSWQVWMVAGAFPQAAQGLEKALTIESLGSLSWVIFSLLIWPTVTQGHKIRSSFTTSWFSKACFSNRTPVFKTPWKTSAVEVPCRVERYLADGLSFWTSKAWFVFLQKLSGWRVPAVQSRLWKQLVGRKRIHDSGFWPTNYKTTCHCRTMIWKICMFCLCLSVSQIESANHALVRCGREPVGHNWFPTWITLSTSGHIDIPCKELTYPTLGKGKSSSNIPWVGIC